MRIPTEKAITRLENLRIRVEVENENLSPLVRERNGSNRTLAALDMAIEALKDVQDRQNPRPLKMHELEQLGDEPFYIRLLDGSNAVYPAIKDSYGDNWCAVWCADLKGDSLLWLSDYGTKWIAYKHKPKEGGNAD